MMKQYVALPLLAVLALAGCVGKSPPVEFYTLSSLTGESNKQAKAMPCAKTAIGVGPISWPYILERPQIVTRSGENKLVFSEFNRWGGSLEEDFSRVLSQNLSLLLGNDHIVNYPKQVGVGLQYRIEIDAQQFDGQLNEVAVLKAMWLVRNHNDNKVLLMRNATITKPVKDSDYTTLVATQSNIVADLSRTIATEMESVCAKRDVK